MHAVTSNSLQSQEGILERVAISCSPAPRDLLDPGIKSTSLASPALAGRFFTTSKCHVEELFQLNKTVFGAQPHSPLLSGYFSPTWSTLCSQGECLIWMRYLESKETRGETRLVLCFKGYWNTIYQDEWPEKEFRQSFVKCGNWSFHPCFYLPNLSICFSLLNSIFMFKSVKRLYTYIKVKWKC